MLWWLVHAFSCSMLFPRSRCQQKSHLQLILLLLYVYSKDFKSCDDSPKLLPNGSSTCKKNCRKVEPFWLPAIDGFLLLPFWWGVGMLLCGSKFDRINCPYNSVPRWTVCDNLNNNKINTTRTPNQPTNKQKKMANFYLYKTPLLVRYFTAF